MNNVLPSSVHLHEKYDLKGSTYKRQASRQELLKAKPTLKDLDFVRLHPGGLMVPAEAYQALVRTIERDCRVSAMLYLQQFKPVCLSVINWKTLLCLGSSAGCVSCTVLVRQKFSVALIGP